GSSRGARRRAPWPSRATTAGGGASASWAGSLSRSRLRARGVYTPRSMIVLASCSALAVEPEHAPLIEAFARLGEEAVAVPWDEATFDWSRPRAVLIRSTWDYHHRRDAFIAWAKQVPRLFNPARVIEENTHKFYLRRMPVPIVE